MQNPSLPHSPLWTWGSSLRRKVSQGSGGSQGPLGINNTQRCVPRFETQSHLSPHNAFFTKAPFLSSFCPCRIALLVLFLVDVKMGFFHSSQYLLRETLVCLGTAQHTGPNSEGPMLALLG